jgi:hypothetical protein
MSDRAFSDVSAERKGGCLCGDVRYTCHVASLFVYCCHCTDCQKRSGSAFAQWAAIPRNSFSLVLGAPVAYRQGATDFWFCPHCSVSLWAESIARADLVFLAAGSLPDTSKLRPIAHIWTKSAQPWIQFNGGATRYDEQPPDFRIFLEQECASPQDSD